MEIDRKIHAISTLSDSSNDIMFTSWTELSDKMLKVQESINEAMELNDLNIADRCACASKLVSNFIASYYGEMMLLDKMKDAVTKVEQDYITENVTKTRKPVYKLEDEIQNSPQVINIKKKIKDQTTLVAFMKEHLQNLKNFGFTVRNTVDILKLEN
jgi:hypothetical protein